MQESISEVLQKGDNLTAIIGLVHKDKVYMGCDSCANSGWEQHTLVSAKIFKLPKANLLAGVSGTFRDLQIVRYYADMELPDGDEPEAVLVKHFVPALRETFKTHGSNVGVEANPSHFDAEILIGFKGRLFLIDPGYAVVECRDYRTIGNGGLVALGAIAAIETLSLSNTKPEMRIRRALAIAEQFVTGVRAPFIVECL